MVQSTEQRVFRGELGISSLAVLRDVPYHLLGKAAGIMRREIPWAVIDSRRVEGEDLFSVNLLGTSETQYQGAIADIAVEEAARHIENAVESLAGSMHVKAAEAKIIGSPKKRNQTIAVTFAHLETKGLAAERNRITSALEGLGEDPDYNYSWNRLGRTYLSLGKIPAASSCKVSDEVLKHIYSAVPERFKLGIGRFYSAGRTRYVGES